LLSDGTRIEILGSASVREYTLRRSDNGVRAARGTAC
jgi:hypothetical protein